MPQQLSSQRARAKSLARRKRREKMERRRQWLDSIAHGRTYAEVAGWAKVSVSTVRREVARALGERGPESVETFVALQRARLEKALRLTDEMIGFGEPRAVNALIALLPQLERYWGLQRALADIGKSAPALQNLAPTPLKSLEPRMEFPPRPDPVS